MLTRNARYNVLNAAYSAVALSLFTPFIKKMAVDFGADNLQLGYLSSWPNAVSVVAVMGTAAAVARSSNKKRLIAGIFLLGRAAALGAAAVPWFSPSARVWALIGFWVLATFPNSAAGTALQSFIADVFPDNERARALASRQSWTTGVGMLVAIAAGVLLDHVFPSPLGYQVLYSVSFLFALIEVFYLMQMEPPAHSSALSRMGAADGGLRAYLGVFQHKPFARFMAASVCFHFTWQMCWPLFDRYQITNLHADNTWLVILQAVSSGVMVLTFPLWARWSERHGNLKMMALAALWLASAPLLNAAATTVQHMVVVNLLTGASTSGVALVLLNCQLEVSPAAGRPVFLAAHAALIALVATIAPMVGAWLLEAYPVRVGFVICTAFRALSATGFLLARMPSAQGKAPPVANLS